MKSSFFWDIMPCNEMKNILHFWMHILPPHKTLLVVDFFLGLLLLFSPEDEDNMFY
jgi:hypothetical protein